MRFLELTRKCGELEKKAAPASQTHSGSTESESVRRELDTANGRVSELEAKLGALQSEAECLRQNAEAAKAQVEKKLREREAELKKDLDLAEKTVAQLQKTVADNEEAAVKHSEEVKALSLKAEEEKRQAILYVVTDLGIFGRAQGGCGSLVSCKWCNDRYSESPFGWEPTARGRPTSSTAPYLHARLIWIVKKALTYEYFFQRPH